MITKTLPFSFTTPNLSCRLVDSSDRAFVADLYQAPSRMAHIGQPLSHKEARALFTNMLNKNRKPQRSAYWLVQNRSCDQVLGIQGISAVPSLLGVSEVGIMLTERAEGQGVPFEALTGMFDYVFSLLSVETLIETHQVSNKAITCVSRRLGFSCNNTFSRLGQETLLGILNKKDWFTPV